MANVNEQAVWVENINLIAEDDPVQGGENGIDNIPHQQLANRTVYLKSEIDKAKGQIPNGETVSLASLYQMIKDLQQIPAPTITQYMIPVGGLFETVKLYANGEAVAKDMGYGTWEQYGEGRVTIAKSSKYALGQMGGEEKVTITEAQMPKHTHKSFMTNNGDVRAKKSDPLWKNLTDYIDWDSVNVTADLAYRNDDVADSMFLQSSRDTGGDQPHNNMQPFVVVGRWVRTA